MKKVSRRQQKHEKIPSLQNVLKLFFFEALVVMKDLPAVTLYVIYSKTCVKRPLKIDKTNILMTNSSLMKVESFAECSPFFNTFDLHKAIIGLENQFSVFLRVAVLHRFYCKPPENICTT